MATMDEFEVDEVIRRVMLTSTPLTSVVPPQATAAELRARADARGRSPFRQGAHRYGFRKWLP